MSGDVFGNGMLYGRIRLLAAFDHRHVFLDPDPVPTSFAERKRLFETPGSSWDDYDRRSCPRASDAIDRGAKWVTLSPGPRRASRTTPQRSSRPRT